MQTPEEVVAAGLQALARGRSHVISGFGNLVQTEIERFVPRDLVIGRAMFVYWSYDESAPSDENPLILFFKNTRWSRTGTMVK